MTPPTIAALSVSPSLDLTYVVDALRIGDINRPTTAIGVAGGKALNAARVATMFGADVTVVAMLGGAIGLAVEQKAVASGIRLSRIDVAAETRSCVSVLSLAGGELTELYERPTAVTDPEWTAALARLDEVLSNRIGWLIVSGGMPAELADGALSTVLDLASRHGVAVALDSHGRALQSVLQSALKGSSAPALLKVNRAEAAEALGEPVDSPLIELARGLRRRTLGRVVVTDGVGGAIGVDSDDTAVHVSLPGHTGAYPVGSGDSFLGALVVALDAGELLETAMCFGTAAATANALVAGAATFERATAEAMLAEVRVIPIAPRG